MCAAAEAARAKYGRAAQFLLVVLPVKATEEYREVKRVSDVVLGVPSQVVTGKAARIGRQNNQDRAGGPVYCANLALKINSKLGGVNVSLSHGPRYLPVLGGARAAPFMILGADVTHPTGPSCKPGVKEPSVAAVVASLDQTLGRWASRVLLQAGRQEVITGMGGATKELLLEFYRANRGAKPQRLVMYRDGVGEAQFEQALAEEFVAMRKACTDLQEDYRPAITFVIVQKRHNTRLLPSDSSAADRKGNVVPGTVVDRGITNSATFDFYLNSHAGVLGTNKPAHYHVLVDEIGFGADGMQLLTYWLCYLYQRTTKSVSYCPPAYYADRAAYRGRQLLIASASAATTTPSAEGADAWFAGIHKDLTNVLYFM
ncbi:Protein argonaute-2 [Tetrabaena socialis]|uniref:Protein argonaute-2 n=1 Tax=Tetrabaena socialis TaxID=47790 RepID=A0A2J7ZQL7_9CHLO|nr:Protein argonaute-2 [Tetrabaena socialis]|eukprot:PNH02563.1 Protein argonaute-2 [Tetrabaena socialis]